MSKSINILDNDYLDWVQQLCKRYRQSQIKAAISVNSEMLKFYWDLGKDIVEMQAEKRWGDKIISRISLDLRKILPGVTGLSQRNIYYCKQFYLLFSKTIEILPQLEAKRSDLILPQLEAKLESEIFSIPWGHYKLLIDKCANDSDKAIFYVRQTIKNGMNDKGKL